MKERERQTTENRKLGEAGDDGIKKDEQKRRKKEQKLRRKAEKKMKRTTLKGRYY